MVASTLIYHPTVSHYLKFVATTVGRDKILRAIQYFARFYAWYLFRLNNPAGAVAPWSTTKTQLGLIRKAMRLGKSVEHARAAATAYDASPASFSVSGVPGASSATLGDRLLRYCTIGRQLGYAGYLAYDNLAFLDTAGIKKSASAKEWGRKASQGWVVGLAFSILAGAYKRMLLQQRRAMLVENEGLGEKGEGKLEVKKIEREQGQVNMQLISDLCDLTIPAFALGYGGTILDDGVVGIAGTVSSVIGVVSQWQKTA